MHFDNQNHCLENPWLFHDFCHFLTNSTTISGLENKNHFPWLFQAAGTLNLAKKCMFFFFFFLSFFFFFFFLYIQTGSESERKWHTMQISGAIFSVSKWNDNNHYHSAAEQATSSYRIWKIKSNFLPFCELAELLWDFGSKLCSRSSCSKVIF